MSSTEGSDEEFGENTCALCNNNDMYWEAYFFTCEGECKRTLCAECIDEMLNESYCRVQNCYYCVTNHCLNNVTLDRYCADCCPESVLLKIKEREKYIEYK